MTRNLETCACGIAAVDCEYHRPPHPREVLIEWEKTHTFEPWEFKWNGDTPHFTLVPDGPGIKDQAPEGLCQACGGPISEGPDCWVSDSGNPWGVDRELTLKLLDEELERLGVYKEAEARAIDYALWGISGPFQVSGACPDCELIPGEGGSEGAVGNVPSPAEGQEEEDGQ